jgi:hypothetical protein
VRAATSRNWSARCHFLLSARNNIQKQGPNGGCLIRREVVRGIKACPTLSCLYARGFSTSVLCSTRNSHIPSITTSDFEVLQASTGGPIAGTIAVTTDGLTATFTPTSALSTSTSYTIQGTAAILDLEGQSLPFSSSTFTTGTQ